MIAAIHGQAPGTAVVPPTIFGDITGNDDPGVSAAGAAATPVRLPAEKKNRVRRNKEEFT